jgi:hypothetical protein
MDKDTTGKQKKSTTDTATTEAANPLAGTAPNTTGYETPEEDGDEDCKSAVSPYAHTQMLHRLVSNDLPDQGDRAVGQVSSPQPPANFGELDDTEGAAEVQRVPPHDHLDEQDAGLEAAREGEIPTVGGKRAGKGGGKLSKLTGKTGKRNKNSPPDFEPAAEPEPELEPVTNSVISAKGGFGKRGQGLKPTTSASQARELSKAEAFHLGGTGVLDGIKKSGSDAADGRATTQEDNAKASEGGDFSLFDDMLAGASVGGEV